jgi:hypothetical protein
LNKYKCSFNKLQSELGVSYDPKRDDIEIKRLTKMLESAPITRDKSENISRKTPNISTNYHEKIESDISEKPRLSKEQAQSLYNHYGAKLQDLLVTDRDKETAKRALADGRDEREVEEIVQASPVGWTSEEAKALVLIASGKTRSEPEISSPKRELEQHHLRAELLAVALPVGVQLINRQLRNSRENSKKFKHATLKKQGRELVYTHDERGEIFRVELSQNQSGELEYSLKNIAEIKPEDITTWRDVERNLEQEIESEIALSRRQSITRDIELSL